MDVVDRCDGRTGGSSFLLASVVLVRQESKTPAETKAGEGGSNKGLS